MTILHINNTDYKGGAAVYALNLHLYCLKKGYNSYFLVNDKQTSAPNTICFDEYESIWIRSLKKIIKLITINPSYRGYWRIRKILIFLQSPTFIILIVTSIYLITNLFLAFRFVTNQLIVNN